jgi:malate/lactate dehydrogenase
LSAALARHGKNARIGVITAGADIMAKFTGKESEQYAAICSESFNDV